MKRSLVVLSLFLVPALHTSNLPASAGGIAIGSPTDTVIEALGEPTQRTGGFACDCAGCRTEEQLYYREDGQNYTITVIDGRVTDID